MCGAIELSQDTDEYPRFNAAKIPSLKQDAGESES